MVIVIGCQFLEIYYFLCTKVLLDNKYHLLYNNGIMKKETLSFRIEPMKHRAHKPLFDDELPFKHRVEKPKKGQYNRRPKHKNRDLFE